jgi:hypothetical protein
MTANLTKLTKQLRCNLYVDFGDDLESAFNAMNVLATASKNPAAVYTAVYGIINTLCNVIEHEVEQETIILDPACAERGCCAHNHLVDHDGVLAIVIGEVNAQKQTEQGTTTTDTPETQEAHQPQC